MTKVDRDPRLDTLRGAFVVLMIVYHAAYIGVQTGLWDFALYEGFWWLFPRFIAAGFLAISGWSMAIAGPIGIRRALRRAARLALPAAAVSAASYIMYGPESFVAFGVLHCLAASALLVAPLVGRPGVALAAGVAALGAGLALGGRRFDFFWGLWLGLRPAGYYPVDYLPLLPWLAWPALGAAARGFFSRRAPRGKAGRPASHRPGPSYVAALAFLGRRSLVVYLAHLPALYGLALLVRSIL
jgi:uncharacterized membrane protein